MNNEMDFSVSLLMPTETILNELQDRKTTQKTLALTYYLAMRSTEPTDWLTVNRAIIARWSVAGLERVKTLARGHYPKAAR